MSKIIREMQDDEIRRQSDEDLKIELGTRDYELRCQFEGRGQGQPEKRDPAIWVTVWIAVMEERFFTSYGKGRKGSNIPSITHACEIIASRGKTRRNGGGGIVIKYNDGREDYHINSASMIRGIYYKANTAIFKKYDPLILAQIKPWLARAERRINKRTLEKLKEFNELLEALAKAKSI